MTLTPQHRQQLLQHPILGLLPAEAQVSLVSKTLYREYPVHTLILRQGERAERFFV